MNKLIVVALIGLLFVSCVSAMSINYYYSPNCGHCQKIAPFINQVSNQYPDVNWNILDVTQGSYNIQGTPFLELITNDGRNILLSGSYEIPEYLECELNEMSTLDCPTSTTLNCETNSFFIR